MRASAASSTPPPAFSVSPGPIGVSPQRGATRRPVRIATGREHAVDLRDPSQRFEPRDRIQHAIERAMERHHHCWKVSQDRAGRLEVDVVAASKPQDESIDAKRREFSRATTQHARARSHPIP